MIRRLFKATLNTIQKSDYKTIVVWFNWRVNLIPAQQKVRICNI